MDSGRNLFEKSSFKCAVLLICAGGGATFCDSRAGRGRCCALAAGTYAVGWSKGVHKRPCPGNDRTSYIYVPKGWVVIAAEHSYPGSGRNTGRVWTLNGGATGKTFVGGNDFDDRVISNVIIKCTCQKMSQTSQNDFCDPRKR